MSGFNTFINAKLDLNNAKEAYLEKNPLQIGPDERIHDFELRQQNELESPAAILNERIQKCLKRGEVLGRINKEFQINLKNNATKEDEDEYYRLGTQRVEYEQSCIPTTSMFDWRYKRGGKTKRRKNSKKTKRRKNSKKTKRRR
uniref:Uncharacterized protein n=1 Tax=viral metagenome TaxID=1070528 RepID=A0A6C0LF25_9ZZZZ